MVIHVGLVFGGRSPEHEISILSAGTIANALATGKNQSKYVVVPMLIRKNGAWVCGKEAHQVLSSGCPLQIDRGDVGKLPTLAPVLQRLPSRDELCEIDVWFPVLHGPNGEDGSIQGLFETLHMPYVGCGILASSLGMDKIAAKHAFEAVGLPQAKWCQISHSKMYGSEDGIQKVCEEIEAKLAYACVIKPANMGSSVGVSKARNRAELKDALDLAAQYDSRIVAEEEVNAREIECSVLGNDNPKVAVLGETVFHWDMYDYERKYRDEGVELIVPTPVSDEVADKIKEMGIRAFQAVGATGISRVDFFYVEASGKLLINEINTMPGFTEKSLYPRMWKNSGIGTADLVDQLIQLGLKRMKLG